MECPIYQVSVDRSRVSEKLPKEFGGRHRLFRSPSLRRLARHARANGSSIARDFSTG